MPFDLCWVLDSQIRACLSLSATTTNLDMTSILFSELTLPENICIIEQVRKVNGVEVDNLKHLCLLVGECNEERLRFDLDDDRVIVLDHHKAKLATSRILKRHRIPSAMSVDLLECGREQHIVAASQQN